MEKEIKKILAVTISLFFISGCQPIIQNSQILPDTITINNVETKTTVRGKAEFPETNSLLLLPSLAKRGDGGEFSTQATQTDIATSSTVSLIYPSDYSNVSLRNVTIATGLTNSSGEFVINPDKTFSPLTNDVFVLEAIKRISGINLSLTTYIKWNGTSWDSITNPGIFINTKTTALTSIVDSNSSVLTSAETINKMPVVSGVTTIQDINANVTSDVINYVKLLVDYLIQNNRDPVGYIKYDNVNLKYIYNNPLPLTEPTPVPTPTPTPTPIPTPTPLTPNYIYTIAGGGFGESIPATSAPLSNPYDVAVDLSGNIFIVDFDKNIIRKVNASTGLINTIAGNGTNGYGGDGGAGTNASLSSPKGIATDSSGNIYIADTGNNRIRKVNASTGIITTVAGDGYKSVSGYGRYSGDNGSATSASIWSPSDLFIDSSGNLFIADTNNNRIRKVNASTGVITTVAGYGNSGYTGDGELAVNAYLFNPNCLFVDSTGNIFISDYNNGRIRKVDSSGIITTVVSGVSPNGISLDSSGNILFSESNKVKKIDSSNVVTVFAGGGSDTGNGIAATNASLGNPVQGIGIDSSGNLFISSSYSRTVKKVNTLTGILTTVAGNGTSGFSGEGTSALNATFNKPEGIAVDSSGNVFIADYINSRIRKVNASTGTISTIAGNSTFEYSGDGGQATSASLNTPSDVAVDSSGNIYIADTNNSRIRKVDASTGIISTIAGNGTNGYNGDGILATNASLNKPYGVTVGSTGLIYIADTSNHRVRKVNLSTGYISTTAGDGNPSFSGNGTLAAASSLYYPYDVTLDSSGNVYIADRNNGRIRKVTVSTGIITTVAGIGIYEPVGDGGASTSAQLNYPTGVALDSAGNIYIADNSNHRIRKADVLTGNISTFAGDAYKDSNNGYGRYNGDNVLATNASLNFPFGIAFDSVGNLYISDSTNNRIRKVVASN